MITIIFIGMMTEDHIIVEKIDLKGPQKDTTKKIFKPIKIVEHSVRKILGEDHQKKIIVTKAANRQRNII